ncbi:LacI family DNA-binding transcriptional regulator [Paenibacillus rhizoplanae]
MAKQRVTLVQVAKDAGVSPATVSHFMNGNFHRMGSETREKISDSITRLGYQVNPVAKKPDYRQKCIPSDSFCQTALMTVISKIYISCTSPRC